MLKVIAILVILNLAPGFSAVAQNILGKPIRVVATGPVDAHEIDLLRFEFQELYYGFEGPNYMRMKGEPAAGAELIAEAELFRPEAVSTVRFEFLNEQGQELSQLFFTKKSGDVFDGGFIGVVKVPNVPFKVRASGHDMNGKRYQCTFQRLFRPVKQRPVVRRLPRGVSPEGEAMLNRMIQAQDQQTRTKLIEEGRKSVDGTITLPRAEVSEATYEPLLSERGNVIGLRIRYAVRVSQDAYYAFSPLVWPIYADAKSRGKIEMQPVTVNVEPLPEGLSPTAAALQLRYGGRGIYKAGKIYRFVVDTIPNFAIQNAQKSRFCIRRPPFQDSPAMESSWRSLVTNDQPVSYGTNIGWTAFKGRTESFSGPGVFYRNFLKEGARECSADANINF